MAGQFDLLGHADAIDFQVQPVAGHSQVQLHVAWILNLDGRHVLFSSLLDRLRLLAGC